MLDSIKNYKLLIAHSVHINNYSEYIENEEMEDNLRMDWFHCRTL